MLQKSQELWSDLMKGAWMQTHGSPLTSLAGMVVPNCCANRLAQMLLKLAGANTTLGQLEAAEGSCVRFQRYGGL